MAKFIEIQSGSQVRMINVENIVTFAPNYGKFTPQTTIELDTDIFNEGKLLFSDESYRSFTDRLAALSDISYKEDE